MALGHRSFTGTLPATIKAGRAGATERGGDGERLERQHAVKGRPCVGRRYGAAHTEGAGISL